MPEPLGKEIPDLATVRDFVQEFSERSFPTIKYKVLSTDVPVDELYRETLVKDWPTEVDMPIYFRVNPSERVLARFGIESVQDAIAVIDNATLVLHGIDPKVGDRISYFGITYEVLTIKHTDYWINSQYPISRVLTLKNINPK